MQLKHHTHHINAEARAPLHTSHQRCSSSTLHTPHQRCSSSSPHTAQQHCSSSTIHITSTLKLEHFTYTTSHPQLKHPSTHHINAAAQAPFYTPHQRCSSSTPPHTTSTLQLKHPPTHHINAAAQAPFSHMILKL